MVAIKQIRSGTEVVEILSPQELQSQIATLVARNDLPGLHRLLTSGGLTDSEQIAVRLACIKVNQAQIALDPYSASIPGVYPAAPTSPKSVNSTSAGIAARLNRMQAGATHSPQPISIPVPFPKAVGVSASASRFGAVRTFAANLFSKR